MRVSQAQRPPAQLPVSCRWADTQTRRRWRKTGSSGKSSGPERVGTEIFTW